MPICRSIWRAGPGRINRGGIGKPALCPACDRRPRRVESPCWRTYVLTMSHGSALMRDVVRNRSVPQIIVSTTDYERLTDLANASLQHLPAVAQELLDEMDRAKVVEPSAVPADVVRMGSTVTFKADDGQTRTLKLVYPV